MINEINITAMQIGQVCSRSEIDWEKKPKPIYTPSAIMESEG